MVLIKKTIPVRDWAIRGAAVLVGVIGAGEIVFWLLQHGSIALALDMGAPRLNFGGAFIAAAGALWLLHTSHPDSPPFRLGNALAVLAGMLGGATLAQDLSAFLGIGQLIGPEDVVAVGPVQALHVPMTEFAFLFSGAALFVLKSPDPRVAICSQWLALVPLALAGLGIADTAYGIAVAMAPHAALAFFVLAIAIMAADPSHGLVRIVVSDTAGGVVTRRLLTILPPAMFVLGWVQIKGEAVGLYGERFGTLVSVLGGITICVIAVVAVATALHHTDLVRKEAMARIRDLNARHERQIEERTEQLAKSLEDLNAANKLLEELSEHDGLTGVANRRYFDKYIDTQIAIARRHNRTLSLVMIDVDMFKAYNDNYGHQAGDRCLKQVAEAVKSCCRRTADVVARYGGEEFAIVLPETGLKGAVRVAETVREAVAQLKIPHDYSAAGPFVSISGGVAATVWQGDDTIQQLIMTADRMLYEAKRQGRNRMVSAPPIAA